MFKMWQAAIVFVCIDTLIVLQLASSQVEASNFETHFTIPAVQKNFNDALSWCTTDESNYNSTLAIVNDSDTQMALVRFLNSSSYSSTTPMFTNLKLSQQTTHTWYLVNGTAYIGNVGNQEQRVNNYLLNCRLKFDGNDFIVEASSPADLRNYICNFEENRCSNGPTGNIVYNGRCYVKYENENLTWFRARERCIDNSGDLAQFQTTHWTLPFNTSWLNKALTYWIGIRWNGFSWKSSGSDYEFIFTWWSNGKPNTYSYECVCVDPNGSPPWSWTDCDCNLQRQFVCLKEVAIQTTAATTTTAMTNKMNPTTATLATSSSPSCVVDDNCACLLVCPQSNKSEALTVGLVLGFVVIIPSFVIILVLVVVIVHLRRQLHVRDKPHPNEGVDNLAKNVSLTEERFSTEVATPDAHYQHLKADPRPATMMPHYDQLNKPENPDYEPTDFHELHVHGK